ncbi:MAG: hypothetical protein A3F35_01690 [Candidatus Woykebacteria bacterium RIFCSPHIGHO2_12_FULL_45_10]|uniref:Putative pre-16S rRNA nuclease n=1 Tax=Candidatus Woykebacteria bacterium RIFCSPHIGHO2_12_FULL_45_10 TaxID=1802603 RepID=A0A1G1WRP6_9BACT|nr:MAG: hypothetical protein A3F35_01690 [Candidatus Woykebacteria bacterium RIFCSPHIGHO2_12_FULL_45_10]
MNFLAIDYGLRKIGLSLSEGELAQPLPILIVKNPLDAQRKILSLIDLHKIETIVFGIPHPDSIKAAKFAFDLERLSNVRIVRVDETLTTKMGQKRGQGKKAAEDSIVASILLQEYLDNLKGAEPAI